MRKQLVPVVLSPVAVRGKRLGYGAVDGLDAIIGAGVVRAGAGLADAKAFVDGIGEPRGKVQSVVRDKGDGAPPQRDVLVDEDVGSANGGELGCCHGVHVGAAAEAVGEEENVGVSEWGKGQRADGYTRAVG